MNRRVFTSGAATVALAEMFPVLAANPDGKCNHDHQCPVGQVCQSNHCVVPGQPVVLPGQTLVITVPGAGSVTCRSGESALHCCRRSVRRACHGEGGDCRKRGKKRCRKSFG